MKLSLKDLPIGEGGLSTEQVESFWETTRGSFHTCGRQEFRDDQAELINRAYHGNDPTVIVNRRGRAEAMLMPIAAAKVMLAAVHKLENDRVLAALETAQKLGDTPTETLDEVWLEAFGSALPTAGATSI